MQFDDRFRQVDGFDHMTYKSESGGVACVVTGNEKKMTMRDERWTSDPRRQPTKMMTY